MKRNTDMLLIRVNAKFVFKINGFNSDVDILLRPLEIMNHRIYLPFFVEGDHGTPK